MGITDWIQAAGRGLMETSMPNIFSGMLTGFLEDQKITSDIVIKWVREDTSLMTLFLQYRTDESDANTVLQRASQWIKDTDWLTREYMIDCLRCSDTRNVRAIASLVLGWPEASRWLDKQILDIREAFRKANNIPEEPSEIEPFQCTCGTLITCDEDSQSIECPNCHTKYKRKDT